MWVQETNPFGNLGLSALVAAIPILILFMPWPLNG